MSTSKKMAWCAWLVASVFYAYQYILRVMPNIMLTDIMKQFDIDTAIYGQFSGVYYIGYCIMHIPIGIALDRYGPKKVMSLCILLTVTGLLPLIFTQHWIYPIIGRFFIGIGSSAAILGTFKIIRMIFKEEQFTRMLSLSVTIGLVGAIYGGVPVSYLCENYSHKTVIEIFAILGVAFSIITYFLVPEIKSEKTPSILSNLKIVITNPKVMLICFLAGLMVGPMEGFADAWGSEFLKKVYGFETNHANYLTSMIYIGMLFAPILSSIAEKTGKYIETISGAGIGMLIIFMLLVLGNLYFQSIGFFVVGICCAYQILAIYKASTYVPENVAGLTTAIANMIIMSFGYMFHSLIGLIIKIYGATTEAFIYGISIVPITLGIGCAGFLCIAYQERKATKLLPL